MRIGLNPLVDARLPPLPSYVAAVITHLPNDEGYHAQRFDVIRRSISSLLSTVDEIPLYVWDNGSHGGFRSWLMHDLHPEFLTLSQNIGKANARQAILGAFPPKTIVCLSDDDIDFSPGWLEAHLQLLEGFPNVGAVSGCPIRTQARWGIAATLSWAREHAEIMVGRFIPDEWEYDFCVSIGRDYVRHIEETESDLDYLIRYNGLEAYAQAHHMQLVGYAGHLRRSSFWGTRAMRSEKTFDTSMDGLGYLRLSTINRFSRHIGNIPDA